jgi:hypothetical protein
MTKTTVMSLTLIEMWCEFEAQTNLFFYSFITSLFLFLQGGDEQFDVLSSSSDDERGIDDVENEISHGLRIPERVVRCFFS